MNTTTIALACIVSVLFVFAIGGALARLKGKEYYGSLRGRSDTEI